MIYTAFRIAGEIPDCRRSVSRCRPRNRSRPDRSPPGGVANVWRKSFGNAFLSPTTGLRTRFNWRSVKGEEEEEIMKRPQGSRGSRTRRDREDRRGSVTNFGFTEFFFFLSPPVSPFFAFTINNWIIFQLPVIILRTGRALVDPSGTRSRNISLRF